MRLLACRKGVLASGLGLDSGPATEVQGLCRRHLRAVLRRGKLSTCPKSGCPNVSALMTKVTVEPRKLTQNRLPGSWAHGILLRRSCTPRLRPHLPCKDEQLRSPCQTLQVTTAMLEMRHTPVRDARRKIKYIPGLEHPLLVLVKCICDNASLRQPQLMKPHRTTPHCTIPHSTAQRSAAQHSGMQTHENLSGRERRHLRPAPRRRQRWARERLPIGGARGPEAETHHNCLCAVRRPRPTRHRRS